MVSVAQAAFYKKKAYMKPLWQQRRRLPGWGLSKKPTDWVPSVRAKYVRSRPPSTPEFKCKDTSVSAASNTSGVMTLLNGCGRGDDLHERIGRQVTLRSVQLALHAAVTSGTGVDQTCRVILFFDKEPHGAAPAGTDLLTANDDKAFRNLSNRKRFWILMDQKIPLNATAEAYSHQELDYYRRISLPVTFNSGDNGDITDIVSGALYLYVIGTQAAGATAGAVTGYARVRYVDV